MNMPQARCVRVVAMVNIHDHRRYCLYCSLSRNEPEGNALILKHFCVKGEYEYRCLICNKDLTTVAPIGECFLCLNNCAKLLRELQSIGVNLQRVTYCLDNYDLSFEQINLN